jgi:hypothetical protein
MQYSEDLLKDTVLAFRYTNADIVGKVAPQSNMSNTNSVWKYISHGELPVFAGRREILSKKPLIVNASGFVVEAVDSQWKVYSCDPFGYAAT